MSDRTAGSGRGQHAARADKRGDRYVGNGSRLWITTGLEADTW